MKALDFAQLILDKRRFMETFLLIENKQRQVVPFVLNEIQADFYNKMSQPGCREVVVKPSQVGFSSLVIAFFLVDTITTPGTTSVIVAHEEFITQRLLHKAQFFYDHIPEKFRPKMYHRSSYEKSFPDINSVLYIGSARAYVFGRGEPIHNFLGDEIAFWPDVAHILTPTLQRVPKEGRVILVSTPNGEDNAHTKLYRDGLVGRGGWRSSFYPWYQYKEYRLPPANPDEAELTNLTTDELALKQRGLDDDQIRWRRAKIAEMESLVFEEGQTHLFLQEYPEDDVTCFLAAGDMAYSKDTIDALARQCVPPTTTIDGIDIWEPPQEGYKYLVSVDPGQGKYSYSAITVWRWEGDKGYHCATWYKLLGPSETAMTSLRIAKMYNNAVLVVEANSHGLAVISVLIEQRYGNLYHRRDIITGRESAVEVGWLTTNRTKPYMIEQLRRNLGNLSISDHRIVSELRNIRIRKSSGKVQYISVGKDDLHDSAAIAVACRDSVPVEKGLVGTYGWQRW
jgi:hypothetical protein